MSFMYNPFPYDDPRAVNPSGTPEEDRRGGRRRNLQGAARPGRGGSLPA